MLILAIDFYIMKLSSKVIVVTGASAGIGRALAEYFGQKQYRVYGLSRKVVPTDSFTSMSVDVTDHQQITEAIQQILDKEQRIDVLINNAGMGMVGAVEDATKDDILKLFNLNLVGAVQMMSAVLPAMRTQKQGDIINISSIGSEMGLPFRGFYSASKSALDKVTEAMRYEVSDWNIKVCALHLGDIKTNIADHRVQSKVSSPYESIFKKVHQVMNAHVDEGIEPKAVAEYIDKLLQKRSWKAHYYFGKLGQKIGVPLKWILPQNFYEKLMRKYNQI